eukprot:356344-Prymnesium_polylepis.1
MIESIEAAQCITKTLTPAAPCPPCTIHQPTAPHRAVPCRAVPCRPVPSRAVQCRPVCACTR